MARTKPNTRRAESRAEKLRKNPDKARKTAEQAFDKAEKNRGKLKEVWDDLMALCRLVKAWSTGTYKEIPGKSLLLAITAVVYFVMPMDAIPDFIPVAGYVDDVAVVAWVISSIRDDIEAFRNWERSGGRKRRKG